jgi:hypothetical protein
MKRSAPTPCSLRARSEAEVTVRFRRRIQSSLFACCLLIACGCARAEFHLDDLQIAGRALGFLDKPLNGDVNAGIVYVPADPQSARQAQALKQVLGEGLRVGNVTLKPILVPVRDVSRANVALFFLTDGVAGVETKAIVDAARVKRTPCITTDLAQVRSGVCAIGIRSQPKVEILVNRAAATSTSVAFSAIFRMMITEI